MSRDKTIKYLQELELKLGNFEFICDTDFPCYHKNSILRCRDVVRNMIKDEQLKEERNWN